MHSWRLGDIAITRIVEYEDPVFHPLDFFDEALPAVIDPYRAWLEPDALDPVTGRMIMPIQSYLLRTRHHTILIDTCIGCHKSSTDVPAWTGLRDETWLRNLARAGVGPEQIDFVFCTHLHLDHCGWNTRLRDGRWVPSFANARYILARTEYAAAELRDDSVFHENVLPVMEAGQMLLVDSDYALDDQVWLTPSPGHTAGHVCVNIASRGQRAIMIGDMMHSPLQLARPDWSPNFEFDRALSHQTRQQFLDHHCDTDTLVLTAHFPSPSVGLVMPHRERAFDFSYRPVPD